MAGAGSLTLHPGEEVFLEVARARTSPEVQQWFQGHITEVSEDNSKIIAMVAVGEKPPTWVADTDALVEVTFKGKEVVLLAVAGKPSSCRREFPTGQNVEKTVVDKAMALRAYYTSIAGTDSQYATASDLEVDAKDAKIEELAKELKTLKDTLNKKAKIQQEAKPEELDSDSDEEEVDEDMKGLMDRLKKASKKAATGTAQGSGDAFNAPKSVKSRFALLKEEEKKPKEASGLDKLIKAMGSDDMNVKDFIQLELLKEMRRSRGGKGEGDEDADNEGALPTQGVAKKLRNFENLKNEIKTSSDKIITEWVEESFEMLTGDTEDNQQAINLLDLHRKIPFGQQKGLHRMYLMQLHVMKYLLDGKPKMAAAQSARNLRALHQVCLDNGEWRTGWELTYLVDPLARKRFGGTARELETIGAYQSALENIEKIKKPKEEDGTPWWEKAKAKKEAAQGKPEPK